MSDGTTYIPRLIRINWFVSTRLLTKCVKEVREGSTVCSTEVETGIFPNCRKMFCILIPKIRGKGTTNILNMQEKL